MTKTILKKISLTKEHEEALIEATSDAYLSKVKNSDKNRAKRFHSIRHKRNASTISKAMASL